MTIDTKELSQFLFIASIILSILCSGFIISTTKEDLKSNKNVIRTGKFSVITLIFTISYIFSYLF